LPDVARPARFEDLAQRSDLWAFFVGRWIASSFKGGKREIEASMGVRKIGDIMKDIKPISALTAGVLSAAIYGGAALLCGPPALFFLTAGSLSRLDADPIDGWVTIAVFAPMLSSVIGFLAGFFMASLFNLFVRQAPRPAPGVIVAIRPQSYAASAGQSHISGFSDRSRAAVGAEHGVING
jgi:hypothetical protein